MERTANKRGKAGARFGYTAYTLTASKIPRTSLCLQRRTRLGIDLAAHGRARAAARGRQRRRLRAAAAPATGSSTNTASLDANRHRDDPIPVGFPVSASRWAMPRARTSGAWTRTSKSVGVIHQALRARRMAGGARRRSTCWARGYALAASGAQGLPNYHCSQPRRHEPERPDPDSTPFFSLATGERRHRRRPAAH